VDEAAYRQVASYLGKGNKVVVLTGAGISAESGVPTFRSTGATPIWRDFWDPTQLSHRDMIYKDLKIVWQWFCYRRELIRRCEVNEAHKLLVALENTLGKNNFTLITQNVDGLHHKAGSKNVVELHGNLWNAKGVKCTHKHHLPEALIEDELPPRCPTCCHPLRPDVVLFGEALRGRDWKAAEDAVGEATVMMVIGTSSLVHPAADLPLMAKTSGVFLVEVNPAPSLRSPVVDLVFTESAVSFANKLTPYL